MESSYSAGLQENNLPIIVLDVDGVICPVFDPTDKFPSSWAQKDWLSPPVDFHTICASQAVVSFFQKNYEEKKADFTWQTTWLEHAPEELAPALNLPAWPLLTTREEFLTVAGWWKVKGIERLVQEGRKIIWLDDDIAYSRSIGDLASVDHYKHLFTLSPDVMMGLQASDLKAIDDKLEEWKNEAVA